MNIIICDDCESDALTAKEVIKQTVHAIEPSGGSVSKSGIISGAYVYASYNFCSKFGL